jgi:hypothetical protein
MRLDFLPNVTENGIVLPQHFGRRKFNLDIAEATIHLLGRLEKGGMVKCSNQYAR